jgi:hypothetical protein
MSCRIQTVMLLALCIAGCARGPEPCTTPGTCGSGFECLANRCVPLGAEPVGQGTVRWVVAPARIAVVTSESWQYERTLPGAIRFGSAADGPAALYLRFDPVWTRAREIDSAFLLLEPMPGVPLSAEDIEVQAARVGGSWQPETLSWLRQPKLASPRSRALARAGPPSTLRIDVTDIIRYEHTHPRHNHGIAVKGPNGDGHGACFATGRTLGATPRLEIYVR